MRQLSMCKSKRYTHNMHVHCCLPSHSHTAFVTPHSAGFWWADLLCTFSEIQSNYKGMCVASTPKLAWTLRALRGQVFQWNQNLLQTQKWWHSKKHKWPMHPIISLPTHVESLNWSTTYDRNYDKGGGKDKQPLFLFFSVLSYLLESQR